MAWGPFILFITTLQYVLILSLSLEKHGSYTPLIFVNIVKASIQFKEMSICQSASNKFSVRQGSSIFIVFGYGQVSSLKWVFQGFANVMVI